MKVTKDCWVIMDKGKRAIACGSTRDRRMVLLENLDTGRILTYETEGKARAGYTVSGFWDETFYEKPKSRWGNYDAPTYLKDTYEDHFDYENNCMPVKACVTVEIE